MPAHLFYFGRRLRSALPIIAVVAVIAIVSVLSSAALGANPAEELAKSTGGIKIDPKGNSWESIQQSIQQFADPKFILRLFLSLSLAVGCAWAIAWHPRRASLADPLADLEERKALILLGVVGAVVAELSGTSQTLAFVIFGIGALLRFRTLLDNPKLTGKAIMVVVVGLACGMGSWAMAVFVTAFSWSHKCRLQSSALYEDKGQMVFLLYIPTGVDPRQLEAEVREKLRKNHVSKIDVDVV